MTIPQERPQVAQFYDQTTGAVYQQYFSVPEPEPFATPDPEGFTWAGMLGAYLVAVRQRVEHETPGVTRTLRRLAREEQR